MKSMILVTVGLAVLLVSVPFVGPVVGPLMPDDAFPKVAPYPALRFADEVPEVLFEDEWYELVALDDIPAAKLVATSKKTFDDRWQKRIAEDLVWVLFVHGHVPGPTVSLDLRHLETGERVRRDGVAMTLDNRRAIWRHRNQDQLVPAPAQLTRAEALEDLRELEMELEDHYSYRHLRRVNLSKALDALMAKVGGSIATDAFAIEIAKLLARFGDGHSRVRSLPLPAGYAPFLLGDTPDGFVAFRPDRSALLDEDHPYLVALDGLPIERWMEAAAAIVADGSPQFVRRQSMRLLREIVFVRRELGLPEEADLELELRDADGGSRTLVVSVSGHRPTYGDWPRRSTGVLPGNVGYLRLFRMDDEPEFLRSLADAMNGFHDTDGLIIDVRENGGGSRAALRLLFPYFMAPGTPPHVANVAAYRLRAGDDPTDPEGFLDNRWLYPRTSSAWHHPERAAIEAFAAGFSPQWTLPPYFSDWHYFVLSRPEDGRQLFFGMPDSYYYGRPVVVLMDNGCYSATDIFLGAFAGWTNVTLMGTASGGGSGRSQRVMLPHSRLQLRLSSMASFRPNGRLYDGNGIEPDIEVRPVADDFVGRSDTQLDAALRLLGAK